MMIKPVSVLAITIVGMMSVFPSNGAPMTSQIQRLLDQKEEKIKQLEECEGKKQGWMIAGISTIGLTAVGVGVNIAQASKSNKLSGEIEQSKQELERQQEKLSRIESNITKKGNGNSKADNDTNKDKVENPAQRQDELKSSGNTASTKYDTSINGEESCAYEINGLETWGIGRGCMVSKPGDWSAVFSYGTVMGISACSDLSGSYANDATDQSKVGSAYKPAGTISPSGEYCYCKVTNSDIVGARWVFLSTFDRVDWCADTCALKCAASVRDFADFRKTIFGQ